MAYDWLEEYAMPASSAKQSGISLSTHRAEYIHRYNRLLDCEKQPHSDFFTHLSMDFEEELDFNEEEPFDLSEYDQYFEWDETEFMRLRFIAARQYASHGHRDDAYAYILRTRQDNIPQHEDTYSRNAQAWHYTNARINELIQEAEQALEVQDRQLPQEPRFRPPKDSLIPPGHSTWTPSPIRSVQGREQGPRGPSKTTPIRGQGDKAEKLPLNHPTLQTKCPKKNDWDTRYDGIQGFSSHLRNRVSETSTPQGGQSPKGRPKTPPEPQRQFKQLKVYDETPSGRPLPTLQQI